MPSLAIFQKTPLSLHSATVDVTVCCFFRRPNSVNKRAICQHLGRSGVFFTSLRLENFGHLRTLGEFFNKWGDRVFSTGYGLRLEKGQHKGCQHKETSTGISFKNFEKMLKEMTFSLHSRPIRCKFNITLPDYCAF